MLRRLWDWLTCADLKRDAQEFHERTERVCHYLREYIHDEEFPEPLPGFDAWRGKVENIEETIAWRDRVRAQRAAVRAEREAAARGA